MLLACSHSHIAILSNLYSAMEQSACKASGELMGVASSTSAVGPFTVFSYEEIHDKTGLQGPSS